MGLFLFCTLNFRSITAGLILTIPLAISNLVGFAIMALTEVGLTVSTYPVSSVAIGFGVDYGIYFISRLLEEKKNAEDLNTAIMRTMTSNGKAIVIIATTLTLGLVCWIFSTLRFQAEMGTFFALLLLLNMLGSLLLVPSLLALIKPKFAR
jgi:predicted RND superfamily exporter protein